MRNQDLSTPDVGVVVTTYLAGRELVATLESVMKLDYPKDKLHTLVVSGEDGLTAQRATEEFSREADVRYLPSPRFEADATRNYGISNSPYPYIFCLDDDVMVPTSSLRLALGILVSDPKVAAVTFPVLSESPTFEERLGHGRFLGTISQTNSVSPCTLYSRRALERVGVYREDMGPPLTIHEDWELGSRLRKRGFKVIEYGRARAVHLGQQTLRDPKTADDATAKPSSNFIMANAVRRLHRYFVSYVRSRWWSMLQVFQMSPLSQLVEYLFYASLPPIFLILLFTHVAYAVFLVAAVLLGSGAWCTVRGYYSAYTLSRRVLYPPVVLLVRVTRTYFFLVGMLMGLSRQVRDQPRPQTSSSIPGFMEV